MRHTLFALLLLTSLPLQAQPQHYRLSYSGLITGFIWKELADVRLELTPQATNFREQAATRLDMHVDTRNYSIAEALHPVRYHWQSLLDPGLQRTLLVRVIDDGASDSHEVYWYDWPKKTIALFRKREQIDKAIPYFDTEPVLVWEKNHFPPPPHFINDRSPHANGLSYLMQSKHYPGELADDAIDPLAMLLKLRQHDFAQQHELKLQLLLDSDLAPYRARLLEETSLQIGDCHVPAIKLEVKRDNEQGEEGLMYAWVGTDAQKALLRLDIDAPLGMMHVKLTRDNALLQGCDTTPPPL